MAIPIREAGRRQARRSVAPTPTQRPGLVAVTNSRRYARAMVSLFVGLCMVSILVLLLHTRIYDRQAVIDRYDRGISTSLANINELRAERAELRSPRVLAVRASGLGMVPGEESEFAVADPMLLAQVIALSGEIPLENQIGPGATTRLEPLEQFRVVKSLARTEP